MGRLQRGEGDSSWARSVEEDVPLRVAMVYIRDFDEFAAATERLFIENPAKTRYIVKYRHKDGQMVLKVTDDVVCLKYKSNQLNDIRKLERLTGTFLKLMSKKPEA